MAGGTGIVGGGLILVILIYFVNKFVGGFLSKAGASAFNTFSSWWNHIWKNPQEGPQIDARLEGALLDEMEAINSNESVDFEIDRVDYDYRSGGAMMIDVITDSRKQALKDEIENIAISFAVVIDKYPYPCEELTVDFLDRSKMPFGSCFVKEEAAKDFMKGDIGNTEFLNGVLETLEVNFNKEGMYIKEPSQKDLLEQRTRAHIDTFQEEERE